MNTNVTALLIMHMYYDAVITRKIADDYKVVLIWERLKIVRNLATGW